LLLTMSTLHRLMRSMLARQANPRARPVPLPPAKLAAAEAKHAVLRSKKTCCF